MAYLTYRRDMDRAWSSFSKPTRHYAKTVRQKGTGDPWAIWGPTWTWTARTFLFAAKAAFYTARRMFNI